MAKDFDYYFAQLRKTESHREKTAEVEIRKLYKGLLADTKQFVAEEYYQLAEDGKLTYEILRVNTRNARFLEEVESRLNGVSPKVSKEIQNTVEDMYTLAYNGMVDAVQKAKDTKELHENLKGLKGATPETVKAAVENPIAGLTLKDTLEKNRKEIIWDIKRQIGVGLTQGDRYDTMARRIAKSLDNDYKKAIRIVRTEAGRAIEAGHFESGKEINDALKNGVTNMRLVKTWKTMKDGKVRDTHGSMEGKTVAMDEMFILPSGAETLTPHQSGVASEDINCRCFVKYHLSDEYGSTDAEMGKPYSLEASPDDKLSIKEYSKAKKDLEKASGKAFSDHEIKAMLDSVNEYTGGDYTNIIAAGGDFKGVYSQYSMLLSDAQKKQALVDYENVEKFLENAPKYTGKVYRGLGFDIGGDYDDGSYDDFMAEIKKGTLTSPSLTSWTTKKSYLGNIFDARTGLDDSAEAMARVTLVMDESKSGVDIKDYARIKGQDEVLFSKNVTYDVVDIQENSHFDDDDVEVIDIVVKLKEKGGKRK